MRWAYLFLVFTDQVVSQVNEEQVAKTASEQKPSSNWLDISLVDVIDASINVYDHYKNIQKLEEHDLNELDQASNSVNSLSDFLNGKSNSFFVDLQNLKIVFNHDLKVLVDGKTNKFQVFEFMMDYQFLEIDNEHTGVFFEFCS